MQNKIDQALALQNHMFKLTYDLASALSVRASDRDGDLIRAKWVGIEHMRPRLDGMQQALRGITRQKLHEQPVKTRLTYEGWVNAANLLARRIAVWGQVAQYVHQFTDTTDQPLLIQCDAPAGSDMGAHIYAGLHRLANPVAKRHFSLDQGLYADIPLPLADFESMMSAAHRILQTLGRSSDARFLDVGCGGGTKVYAAAHFFGLCDGLEIDADYRAAAEQALGLLRPHGTTLHAGDALTFEAYGEYDVIYFYRPLKDDAKLAQLEARVFAQAKPGTLVVAPYRPDFEHRHSMQGARVCGPIYIVGATQDQADHLRRQAEKTRLIRRLQTPDLGFDPGFWGPILYAAVQDPDAQIGKRVAP